MKGGFRKMANNNTERFLKAQRKGKTGYLAGARDNRTGANSNPEYNNNNDTDISVGATGREALSDD